jgi:hypothetical protein
MINEEINLKIAIIAGWTEISEWNPSPKDDKPVKVYQGTNEAHPELGKFIPNYVKSLDAIVKVFDYFKFDWNVGADGRPFAAACKDVMILERYYTLPSGMLQLYVGV